MTKSVEESSGFAPSLGAKIQVYHILNKVKHQKGQFELDSHCIFLFMNSFPGFAKV